MPFGLVLFGKSVTLSFNSDAVQQLWPRNIAQVAQYFYQVLYIMAVYRPEIAELERLK